MVVGVEEVLVGGWFGCVLVILILCCYCFLWWGVEAPCLVVPLFGFCFFSCLFFLVYFFFSCCFVVVSVFPLLS